MKQNKCAGIRAIFSVILMAGSLLFLTASNFFLYPAAEDTGVSQAATSNVHHRSEELPLPINTEEKSTESGFSLMEELLHEHHLLMEPGKINSIFQNIAPLSDKLQIVHYELLSPPPEI